MVESIERYKRVCSQLDSFCKRMDETFRLFVQLSTAVIGGYIWLKLQENAEKLENLFYVARWIIPVMAVATIFQIACDHRSWWGYRKAEAAILERADLNPRYPNSGKLEFFRILLTAFIGLASYIFLR